MEKKMRSNSLKKTVCCSLAKDQAISCVFKGKPEQRMPSGVCIHQMATKMHKYIMSKTKWINFSKMFTGVVN